jgi:hypothetical protein
VGLKQNTSILAQLPLRQRGGGVAGIRSMWGRTDLRNQSIGEGIPSELAGIPSGHLAPSSWVLPYKPGAMSAFTSCVVQFSTSTPTIAAGRNIDGNTTVTITVNPADGQLVVSAVGSTSITFTAAANLAGALSAQGAASFAFTVPSATLGAIVDAQGSAPITWSLSATPRAIGNLSGDITPFTELSPQSLAAAVWSALAAQFNEAGTMGQLLNNAGAGATPAVIAAEVWATPLETLTAEEIMRVVLAALAGGRSGLGTSVEEYLAQDGTTPRITFTPDAQGNGTPIINAS